MKLWTVSVDYGATGEGRSLFAWIGDAQSEQDARERFGEAFDPFWASGARAVEGVIEDDPVVSLLFTRAVLSDVRGLEGRAHVALTGRLHVNFS